MMVAGVISGGRDSFDTFCTCVSLIEECLFAAVGLAVTGDLNGETFVAATTGLVFIICREVFSTVAGDWDCAGD